MCDSLTCGMTQVNLFPMLYTLKYSNCPVISFNDLFQKLFLPLSGGGIASEADIS